MYFRCSLIISPLKRAGPFIWRNLNPLHPKMLCAKFGWKWPSGSGGEDENVKKFTTTMTTTTTTDNRQILIRKAHLSLRLRWGKKPFSTGPSLPSNWDRKNGKKWSIFPISWWKVPNCFYIWSREMFIYQFSKDIQNFKLLKEREH